MAKYEFVLHFQLPLAAKEPETYLVQLQEAGCDDAVVGIGLPGSIALDFCREAENAAVAVSSAIQDVKNAIPGVVLTEVGPDLLNTSDIADVLSERIHKVTRQAMRKYATGQIARVKTRFPAAAVTCSSPLWHFGEVLDWLVVNGKLEKTIANQLIETSKVAWATNSMLRREKDISEELKAMVEKLVLQQNADIQGGGSDECCDKSRGY